MRDCTELRGKELLGILQGFRWGYVRDSTEYIILRSIWGTRNPKP